MPAILGGSDHGKRESKEHWVCGLALAVAVSAILQGCGRRNRSAPPTSKPVITNTIGMKLALIPAGEFLMGSPDSDDQANNDEKPQDLVRIIKPFRMGVYEVTQSEWKAVMGTTPWKGEQFVKEGDRYPATYVSWLDATEFCRKLTDRERGAGRLKAGESYRLPTEAQWEYACRAGTKTRFSFGDDEADLKHFAWYVDNAHGWAHPMGQKSANAWGLFDMHGNVSEWCSDSGLAKRFDGSPAAISLGGQPQKRGGCSETGPWTCRSAYHSAGDPWKGWNALGFRVVRTSGRSQMPVASEERASDDFAPDEEPESIITNSIGIELALIPAGAFYMGSPDSDDQANNDEKPQHQLRITRPFRLGVYEVTQGEWTAVMGTTPWKGEPYVKRGVRYPATFVSWEDATEFRWELTLKERRTGELRVGESYRLPTEAEWEYACRAGSVTRYHFGDAEGSLAKYAWVAGAALGDDALCAHEVGRKRPNAWGLFDMHGNV